MPGGRAPRGRAPRGRAPGALVAAGWCGLAAAGAACGQEAAAGVCPSGEAMVPVQVLRAASLPGVDNSTLRDWLETFGTVTGLPLTTGEWPPATMMACFHPHAFITWSCSAGEAQGLTATRPRHGEYCIQRAGRHILRGAAGPEPQPERHRSECDADAPAEDRGLRVRAAAVLRERAVPGQRVGRGGVRGAVRGHCGNSTLAARHQRSPPGRPQPVRDVLSGGRPWDQLPRQGACRWWALRVQKAGQD